MTNTQTQTDRHQVLMGAAYGRGIDWSKSRSRKLGFTLNLLSKGPQALAKRYARGDRLVAPNLTPHRVKLCSTNPLERLNKEIKRRSEVVGVFPNERSFALSAPC
jgi:hypothetical protein